MARGLGGEGGARGGRDPNAGGGSRSGGGSGAAGDRSVSPAEAFGASLGRGFTKASIDPRTGKPTSPASGGGKKKSSLPPGYNPLKYNANPTQSFEPTIKNVGTLLNMVDRVLNPATGIPATVADIVAPGLNPLGISNPLNPFEKPTGTVNGAEVADQQNRAAQGATTSQMGNDRTIARSSAELEKKKRKEPKPGFTLLQGAGGTLLGS